MSKRERKFQRKAIRRMERAARRRGRAVDVGVVEPNDRASRDRFVADMQSGPAMDAYDRVLRALSAWRAANPHVELKWQPHPPVGKTVVVGPLGMPVAQRYLAANKAALDLLAHLDRESGGKALTLHAMVALEFLGMREPAPHRQRAAVTHKSPGMDVVDGYDERRHAVQIPLSPCPGCGAMHDGAGDPSAQRAPEPGDAGVCVACGTVCIFDDQLRKRAITAADWATFDDEMRQALEQSSAVFRGRALAGRPDPGRDALAEAARSGLITEQSARELDAWASELATEKVHGRVDANEIERLITERVWRDAGRRGQA